MAWKKENLLAPGVVTVAYSYIGPHLTEAVYRKGTIGRAKDHLEATAFSITDALAAVNGHAYVSVNKALVTQASSAIPVIPLYISLLYKIMKQEGTHEGCIEQIQRLFKERLYANGAIPVDEKGRIRIRRLGAARRGAAKSRCIVAAGQYRKPCRLLATWKAIKVIFITSLVLR